MRATPSVSFNLNNDYERVLHEYALEQDKYFSKYIKRLIEKDRAGKMDVNVAPAIMPVPELEEPYMKFTKTALRAFT